jgi:hypothetical protein
VLEAEEEALEVCSDQLVEGALRALGDLAEFLRPGVVDRAVEAAVALEDAGDERLDTSTVENSIRPPAPRIRSATAAPWSESTSQPTTIAPVWAKASASTAPHPPAVPVIRTTLSSNENTAAPYPGSVAGRGRPEHAFRVTARLKQEFVPADTAREVLSSRARG